MKFVFQNDTVCNRIKFIVSDTWMCLERGEGEEEIANHGRSRVKSFSQETEATGQQTPMIGEHEPKLHSKSQVQDAHDSPTQLPFSLSSYDKVSAALNARKAPQGSPSSDSPRAWGFVLASMVNHEILEIGDRRCLFALRNLMDSPGEPSLSSTNLFCLKSNEMGVFGDGGFFE